MENSGFPDRGKVVGVALDVKGFGEEAWKWAEEWSGFKYQY